MSRVGFYSARGKYGCFSNFSRHPITVGGKVWPTNEHYFQAQKFAGTEYEEKVRLAATPGAAARLGRSRKLPLRKDWNKVKEKIMMAALRAKFSQYQECREVLMSTNESYLCEDSPTDYYWGVGKKSTGKNRLGVLLMELREELGL